VPVAAGFRQPQRLAFGGGVYAGLGIAIVLALAGMVRALARMAAMRRRATDP